MPSFTALSGRAGDQDRAFISASELRTLEENKLPLQQPCERKHYDRQAGESECCKSPILERSWVFVAVRQLVCVHLDSEIGFWGDGMVL